MSEDKNSNTTNLRVGGLLALSIADKSTLFSAYMPYVKNGGIFLPTTKEYKLGQEIFLLLQLLMDSPEKIPVASKVIWITHKDLASGKLRPGIGVQFGEKDKGATQKKIDIILGGALRSEKMTRTM